MYTMMSSENDDEAQCSGSMSIVLQPMNVIDVYTLSWVYNLNGIFTNRDSLIPKGCKITAYGWLMKYFTVFASGSIRILESADRNEYSIKDWIAF